MNGKGIQMAIGMGLAWLAPFPLLAETALLSDTEQRRSEATFFLFAPISTTGTSTVAGQGADIDMSLSDALDVLDFTGSGRYETWKGDWGLIVEGTYLGISDDVSVTLPGPIGVGLDVDVETEQFWLSVMGGYRFGRGTTPSGNSYVFDVSGGVRYNHLRQDVDIAGPMMDVNLGGTETWFEPVIGGRAAMELADGWATAAIFDASGFGVSDNDLAFSATWAFSKRLSDRASLRFGYRYYSIDFETNRSDGVFGYDVEQHGPFIGLGISF